MYVALVALGLLVSALLHLLRGAQTDRMMRQPRNVRLVGALLLAVALPCVAWRGWYFTTLGALLGVSGALRLLAPQLNIRLQTRTYPRWVHGVLLLTGAVLTWFLRERGP
jgi:hypothetical protein